MKYTALAAGIAALAATAAAAGTGTSAPATAAVKMQPGMWQTTIEMTMANLPRLRAERTYRRCITQADIDKNDVVPQTETRADLSCTTKDFKRTGNTATYRLECTGDTGKTSAEGKITFTSATAYDATIRTTGQVRGRSVETNRTVHAERVGDCSSAPQKPAAAGSAGG